MNNLGNIIKAILFVSGDALEDSYLREKLGIDKRQYSEVISELITEYSGDNGLHLLHFNGKLQFATNPTYSEQIEGVLNPVRERELSTTLLQTLAIIAFKQPITRLEVEEIRGVDCTYSVNNLLNYEMIYVSGKKDAIGKPNLFSTTDKFLKRFELTCLEDLPDYDEFIRRIDSIPGLLEELANAEKPMFDTVEEPVLDSVEKLPSFLEGEDVAVIE